MAAPGDVYFMAHRALHSAKPHFCIVVGCDGDKRVVVSFATSQYDKRLEYAKRMGYPKETIVQVAADRYTAFDRLTVIDCNSVYVQDAPDFDAMVSSRGTSKKPSLPSDILARIIKGIHASPRSTDEIRRIIGNPTVVAKASMPRIEVSKLPKR